MRDSPETSLHAGKTGSGQATSLRVVRYSWYKTITSIWIKHYASETQRHAPITTR